MPTDWNALQANFAAEDLEWRPVEGAPGYSVSNTGLVRSDARTLVQSCYTNGHAYRGKVLAQHDNGNGYLCVKVPTPKGKRWFRVHRLVAFAFLPDNDPNRGLDVNHKNGVRSDNRADNLEWVTRSENLTHGYRINKTPHRKAKGSESGTAKLDESKVAEIRARAAGGESLSDLARVFDVGYTNIWLIVKRKTWRHV